MLQRFYLIAFFIFSSVCAMDEVQLNKERALALVTHKAHQELFEKIGTNQPISAQTVSDIVMILNSKGLAAHYLLEVKYTDANCYSLQPNQNSPYDITFLTMERRLYNGQIGTCRFAKIAPSADLNQKPARGFPLLAHKKDQPASSIQLSTFYDGSENVGWYNLLALLAQTGNVDALNTITSSSKQSLCKSLRAPMSFKQFEDAVVAAHAAAIEQADPARTKALLELISKLSQVQSVYNFQSYHDTIGRKIETLDGTIKTATKATGIMLAVGMLGAGMVVHDEHIHSRATGQGETGMFLGIMGFLGACVPISFGTAKMKFVDLHYTGKETHLPDNQK